MYVKVFSDLLQSSLWCEDSDTRIVWLTLLLMADQDGVVRSTAPGIANHARVKLDVTRKALEKFESPDPDSRTAANEGRRIERIDGGYFILNYGLYRALKTQEERRAAVRKRVRRHRERKKEQPPECNADVTQSNPIQTQTQRQKETPDSESSGVPSDSCEQPLTKSQEQAKAKKSR